MACLDWDECVVLVAKPRLEGAPDHDFDRRHSDIKGDCDSQTTGEWLTRGPPAMQPKQKSPFQTQEKIVANSQKLGENRNQRGGLRSIKLHAS